MNTLRIALVALSIAAAAPVAAQDFTSMDLTAMNDAWWAGQQDQMGAITYDIIAQNVANPQVQAMYYQAVQQGYYGSLEQFAYAYAENGGFTRDGIERNRQLNSQINSEMAGQNATFMNQGTVYGPAYGAYTDGYSNIMNQRGMGFSGW